MSRPDLEFFIGANANEFHAAMKRLKGDAASTGREAGRSLAALSAGLRGFGGLLGAAAGGPAGIAAAIGLGTVVETARRAIDSVLELGAAARTAGVDFEAFQELKFAAEQNRVGVDALTDGLKEMQLRADEFVTTGGGPAAEAFRRIGMDASATAAALAEPDRMFETIIERIRTLPQAAQIRVLDEIFGGSAGEQFIRLLDEGAGRIDDLRAKGRAFGVVMDEEFLAKAEEVNAAWNTMSTVVGTHVRGAVVSVISSVMELGAAIVNVTAAAADMEGAWMEGRGGIARATNEANAIAARRRRLLSSPTKDDEISRDPAARRAVTIQAALDPLNGFKTTPFENEQQMLERRWAGNYASLIKAARGGGRRGGRAATADGPNEFQKEAAAMRERIALIQAETAAMADLDPLAVHYEQQILKSKHAQELLNAAQKAGVAVTPAMTAEINALADSYAQAEAASARMTDAHDEARRSAEEAMGFARDVTQGLIDDLMNGESAADAFANALSRIADRLMNDVLDSLFSVKNAGGGLFGGGGLMGLLGGLFGGAKTGVGLYHSGGIAGLAVQSRSVSPALFAGAPRYHGGGIAGLMPNEVPAILQRGEMVLTDAQQRAMGARTGGGGAGVHVTVSAVVDPRGNIIPVVQSVSEQTSAKTTQAGIQRYDQTSARRLPRDTATAQQRGLG